MLTSLSSAGVDPIGQLISEAERKLTENKESAQHLTAYQHTQHINDIRSLREDCGLLQSNPRFREMMNDIEGHFQRMEQFRSGNAKATEELRAEVIFFTACRTLLRECVFTNDDKSRMRMLQRTHTWYRGKKNRVMLKDDWSLLGSHQEQSQTVGLIPGREGTQEREKRRERYKARQHEQGYAAAGSDDEDDGMLEYRPPPSAGVSIPSESRRRLTAGAGPRAHEKLSFYRTRDLFAERASRSPDKGGALLSPPHDVRPPLPQQGLDDLHVGGVQISTGERAKSASKGIGASSSLRRQQAWAAPGAPSDTFQYYKLSDDPREKAMHELWKQKRQQRLEESRAAQELHDAIDKWSLYRSRVEEEITRRLESSRFAAKEPRSHEKTYWAEMHHRNKGLPDRMQRKPPSGEAADDEKQAAVRSKSTEEEKQAGRKFILLSPYNNVSLRRPEPPNYGREGHVKGFRNPHPDNRSEDIVGPGPKRKKKVEIEEAESEPSSESESSEDGEARMERAIAAYRASMTSGKPRPTTAVSVNRQRQMVEARAVTDAFAKADLSINPKYVERAIYIPEDRSYACCMSKLPRPWSGLTSNPFLASKSDKKKGKKAGKKGTKKAGKKGTKKGKKGTKKKKKK
eukprot:Rmarinus@m.9172